MRRFVHLHTSLPHFVKSVSSHHLYPLISHFFSNIRIYISVGVGLRICKNVDLLKLYDKNYCNVRKLLCIYRILIEEESKAIKEGREMFKRI